MKTINLLHVYRLPEKRRDEPEILADVPALCVSSIEAQYGSYLLIGVNGDSYVVAGQQVTKSTKNAMHTVKGCMTVTCELDTFDAAPKTYDEVNKMTRREGGQISIVSTSMPQFVAVKLPHVEQPIIVKGEELLAAVENTTGR